MNEDNEKEMDVDNTCVKSLEKKDKHMVTTSCPVAPGPWRSAVDLGQAH